MQEVQCPSCGAPNVIKNAASLYVVCSYCSTTSVRKDMNLEEVGKAAALKDDGSPLQIGSQGRYKSKPFEIIGRIQLQFPAGFWNEWHLDWGSKSAWLGEATGLYVFTQQIPTDGIDIPAFSEMVPGYEVKINKERFFVKDIQKGVCVSAEGELPFSFQSEYQAKVVDLASRKDNFATIDYSEENPLLFLGEFQELRQLSMKNLKEVYNFKAPRL